MKAIIMAGGEGSRLRPLTCCRPKPMVPVLNRPVMSHIVELLKKYGYTDIGVTLQYQPEAIKDHFGNGSACGVNMRYFVEDTPLGTAGSVKNAGDFLDGTFLVISGDALTDFDLAQALDFHKKQGAMATLVLTRVDTPLEYGVVITGSDGRVTQFLEKPGWGEVFSDTVNTGIYILEPEVMDYVEPGQKFDFSKDLFPMLLKENKPLFGQVQTGYWCDIGSLKQYQEAQYDALSGKVKLKMPGKEILPGVWAEEGVDLHPSVNITGPVLLGAGCRVAAGCRIEPFTVLGEGCSVRERASIKKSSLWNHVYVGPEASLRGAVLCSRVQVLAGAGIYEGAVVGDDSIIKENSLVKPDVKLWPHKIVEKGATVQRSLIWGTSSPKKYFGFEGISGLINIEITPESSARLGAAFASVLGSGTRLALSSDSYASSIMLKEAIKTGMQSAGAQVLDLGNVITPVHRFGVREYDCLGGIHVKISSQSPQKVTIICTNAHGGNVSRDQERKIENAMAREDFLRVGAESIYRPAVQPKIVDHYLTAICEGLSAFSMREADFKLVLCYDQVNLNEIVNGLFSRLGLRTGALETDSSITAYRSWRDYQELLPDLAQAVVDSGADAGVVLDHNADHLILIDNKGQVVQEELLTALLSLIILQGGEGPVVVPVTSPRVIDDLAEKYQGKVVRTKTALQDFLEKVLDQANGVDGLSQFFLHFDGLAALVRVLGHAAHFNVSLSDLVAEIPEFFMSKGKAPVSWEAKGRVIRQLIQDPSVSRLELLEGVKVFHPDGWTLVLPDPDEPFCRIFSEGSTMEIAESLTDMYVKKINDIAGATI